jgi:hypothetical protein
MKSRSPMITKSRSMITKSRSPRSKNRRFPQVARSIFEGGLNNNRDATPLWSDTNPLRSDASPLWFVGPPDWNHLAEPGKTVGMTKELTPDGENYEIYPNGAGVTGMTHHATSSNLFSFPGSMTILNNRGEIWSWGSVSVESPPAWTQHIDNGPDFENYRRKMCMEFVDTPLFRKSKWFPTYRLPVNWK